MEHSKRCFYPFAKQGSWIASWEFCKRLTPKGSLAEMHTEEENAAVKCKYYLWYILNISNIDKHNIYLCMSYISSQKLQCTMPMYPT